MVISIHSKEREKLSDAEDDNVELVREDFDAVSFS